MKVALVVVLLAGAVAGLFCTSYADCPSSTPWCCNLWRSDNRLNCTASCPCTKRYYYNPTTKREALLNCTYPCEGPLAGMCIDWTGPCEARKDQDRCLLQPDCKWTYDGLCFNMTTQKVCRSSEWDYSKRCNITDTCCTGYAAYYNVECAAPGETCCSGTTFHSRASVCKAGMSCCNGASTPNHLCYNATTQQCCKPPSNVTDDVWVCPSSTACGAQGKCL
eukprot:Sspe_Gene.115567::Locus_103169_Transcript_2_2_Confidence_0.750_Length_824::g.115567::m.115567